MSSNRYSTVSFYVGAHADDWQLFMQPHAYKNIVAEGDKVVFIVTTAGDAGMQEEYWQAREAGMQSSIRFALAPISMIEEEAGVRNFNSHAIHYCRINDTKSYFLRLPDGGIDGNGFSACKNQSLQKFKNTTNSPITSIDGSARYDCWKELLNTLAEIVDCESEAIDKRYLHYLNPNITANPNDHADHIATGLAIQALPNIKTIEQNLYRGYSIVNEQKYMQPEDLFWKAAMFAAYEKEVFDKSNYSTLKETVTTYQKWCMNTAECTTEKVQSFAAGPDGQKLST